MLRNLLRPFKQNISFSLTVIATLTLGFAATAALSTVVHSLLLKPLPYANPAELVYVPSVNADAAGKREEYTSSITNFQDWRERNRVFRSMAGIELNEMALTGDGDPRQIDMGRISANFFETLGVRPHKGRFFSAEEETAANHVAILSYSMWTEAFGRSENLENQKVILDGISYQVIGVAPQGFRFIAPAQLWIPMDLSVPRSPRVLSGGMNIFARIKPGVKLDAATRDMERVAAELTREFPDTNTGWSAKAVDIRESDTRRFRAVLWILSAGVLLLLVISCVNVANLLLSRAMARAPEVAVRIALGAGNRQVFIQLLGEYLVLTMTSLVLGLLIAFASIGPIASLSPLNTSIQGTFRILSGLTMDWRIPVLMFLLAVAISVIFSLVSLSGFRHGNLASVLKSEGRQSTGSTRSRRLRNLLLISEIAMSCILLTAAGWIVQCFLRLNGTNPGFETADRISFKINMPAVRYDTHEKRALFLRQARERLLSVPGVKTAGASTRLPLNEFAFTTLFNIEGRPPAKPGEALVSNFRRISAGYFSAVGIRLLEGREFEETDVDGSMPVAIVSREFARRFFPGQNAIGKRIMRQSRTDRNYRTIVGIVDDVKDITLWVQSSPSLYVPFYQGSIASINMVVVTKLSTASANKAIQSAIWSLDSNLPLADFGPMDQIYGEALSRPRFTASLITIFAVLGLVLAAIGVYGSVSYSISQREREIGIRMAIGSQPREIARLLLRQGFPVALLGISVAMAGTWLVKNWASQLDYAAGADPVTEFIFSALFLLCVWCFASYLPAKRASKLDPATVLRC